MVEREARNVVLQRIQSGRRQHAGLAHAAAQHLARTMSASDELARPQQYGARRRAQPFAQARRNRVEARGRCVRLDAERGGSVE